MKHKRGHNSELATPFIAEEISTTVLQNSQKSRHYLAAQLLSGLRIHIPAMHAFANLFHHQLAKNPVYKQPVIASHYGLHPVFAKISASNCDHQDDLPIKVRIPRSLAESQDFIVGSPQGFKICEIPGSEGVIRDG
jgi:hypothetical protein